MLVEEVLLGPFANGQEIEVLPMVGSSCYRRLTKGTRILISGIIHQDFVAVPPCVVQVEAQGNEKSIDGVRRALRNHS